MGLNNCFLWEAVLAGVCEAETRRAQCPVAIYLVASHCKPLNMHPANASNEAFLVLAEVAKALISTQSPHFIKAL